jgi:acetyl-CoA acyltransferase
MRDVLVAGTGMTRFGAFETAGLADLAAEATRAALRDAELDAADVQMTFFANSVAGLITGQEAIRGQTALRDTGVLGAPLVNIENACASGSSAVHLAWMAVASGRCDIAIAVGAEKLVHPDQQRSLQAVATGIDLARRDVVERQLDQGTRGKSLFMDIYASKARAYMRRSGACPRDFAAVAVKNHRHGALNPRAHYRDEVGIDDVLASRTISDPITLLMCSPITDGAAALVLVAGHRAPTGRTRVRIRATALVSGADDGERASVRAARLAYEQAGLGPDDLDVIELHDAAAPAELEIYEELGLCGPGDGPALIASAATSLGGRVPVNPSGGLISRGHPIAATGCAQLVELADQLRGRAGPRQVAGARVGLAENAGGYLGPDEAAATVTILAA